jgi:hypothetical protein
MAHCLIKLHGKPQAISQAGGTTVSELLQQEGFAVVAKTTTIEWDRYESAIEEFESLGYKLEKHCLPDDEAYDTLADSEDHPYVVLLSDNTKRFWLTTARYQESNHEVLKRILLEAS